MSYIISNKWHYYNDNEPSVCAWIKKLIAANVVPDGEVDERSITEVRPEEVKKFIQCHWFAGVLGWPLALRLAGWPEDRRVWTGSCPCQPLSSAGQHKGHADQRHLWPAFQRLIAECGPATVFGEQVASKDGREWFSGVRADLEHMGYACGGVDMPAPSVGSPHIRQRLWWVAHAEGGGWRKEQSNRSGGASRNGSAGQSKRSQHGGLPSGLADAERTEQPRSFNQEGRPLGYSETSGLADAECSDGRTGYGTRRTEGGDLPQQGRQEGPTEPTGCRETSGLADADGGNPDTEGLQRSGEYRQQQEDGGTSGLGESDREGRIEGQSPSPTTRYGSTAESASDTGWLDNTAINRTEYKGEAITKEERAEDRVPGAAGSRGFWDDFDLIPCGDEKARRVEPGTFPLAHGLPRSFRGLSSAQRRLAVMAGLDGASLSRAKGYRVRALRGFGNAIVPQVAEQFIRAFIECDHA